MPGTAEVNPLLHMLPSTNQFSQVAQGCPQQVVGLQNKSRVLYTLSQGKALLPQLMRRP